MKAIALKELSNEDYRTQLARGYSNIPKGSEVEVLGTLKNFYGEFARVSYEGNTYYVAPKFLKEVK